jgi:hypothetical protein
VTEKHGFIDAGYAGMPEDNAGGAPTIVPMCAWLGVSKSGTTTGGHGRKARP